MISHINMLQNKFYVENKNLNETYKTILQNK